MNYDALILMGIIFVVSMVTKAPAWKWEWNLNTVVILLGFAGGTAAWGATWERLTADQEAQSLAIDKLDSRLTALEVKIRALDTQELRISNIEKQASAAAVAM